MRRFFGAAALLFVACGGGSSDGAGGGSSSGGADAAIDPPGNPASDAGGDASGDAGQGPVDAGPPADLATGLSYPWCLAADATNIYYCSSAEIWTVPKAGGTPAKLAKNANQANNFSISVGANVLYVVDYAGATARVPLPAGGWTWNTTGSGVSVARSVVYDGASTLYWGSDSANTVVKVDVNGGGASNVATGQTLAALSGDATSLFWATKGASGQIIAKPLPSGTATPIAPVASPQRLVADANNLYFVAVGSGSFLALFSLPRAGGTPKEIFGKDEGMPLGYAPGALASDGTNVYFAITNGTIYKASPSGGASLVVDRAGQSTELIVDATNIYWVDGIANGTTGTLKKVAKP
jgi:hypothetical protein